MWPCPNNLFDTLLPQAVTEPVVHYYPRASNSFIQIRFIDYFFRVVACWASQEDAYATQRVWLGEEKQHAIGRLGQFQNIRSPPLPTQQLLGPSSTKENTFFTFLLFAFLSTGSTLDSDKGVELKSTYWEMLARTECAHAPCQAPTPQTAWRPQHPARWGGRCLPSIISIYRPKTYRYHNRGFVWCTVFRAALEGLNYNCLNGI